MSIRFQFTALALIVFLSAGCRNDNKKSTPSPYGEIGGRYSYQTTVSAGKERVIIREYWSIVPENDSLSIDVKYSKLGYTIGSFPCNGSSSYNVNVDYKITDFKVVGSKIIILKAEKKHTPGACDGDIPDFSGTTVELLQGKRLFVSGGKLKNRHTLYEHSVGGSWMWTRQSRISGSNDSKYEVENWYLTQTSENTIKGYYERTETRLSGDGEKFSCNGETRVVLFSRYSVEGKITPTGEVNLKETGYTVAGNDPCEPSGKRYLDTFSGILVGNKLIIKSPESSVEQELIRSFGDYSHRKNGKK
ncbi:MAG: hypothetical protein JXR95_06975 [Deltaproteobacteria bacterium]|nr:hypothetical protein [Deltaproteobacteria bacterium]